MTEMKEVLPDDKKEVYRVSNDGVDFEEAFEASGYGRFNDVLTFVMGIAMMGIILETLGAGYIISAVMCEFQMTDLEKGMFSSSVFIGIVVSSPIWGYLTDVKGRRAILLPTLWVASISSIISSFSPNANLLIVSRCVCGFFISATGGNLYTYLGEMHVNKSRAQAITMVAFSISLALIALPGLAWSILPLNISLPVPLLGITYSTWRLYIVICSIPSFIVATTLIWYPESPKFLYVNDKKDEAIKVLKKMYSINSKKAESEFPVSEIKDLSKNSSTGSVWNQILPLFKPPLLRPFAIVCYGQATLFSLSSGLYLWFPVVFNHFQDGITPTVCDAVHIGYNNTHETKTCDESSDSKVYIMGMILGTCFASCFLLLRVLINYIDKKIIYIGLMSASGLSTIALHWVTKYYVIITLFTISMCAGCAGGLTTAIGVELFPTQLRGMAIMLSLMVGRLGAIIGANLSGYMFEHVCEYTFLTFGINGIVFVATIFCLPKPETIKERLERKGIIFQ